MELNTDNMVKQQNAINAKLFSQPEERGEKIELYHNETVQPTKTNIIEHDNSIILTRYINNEIVKVAFGMGVKVVEILPYLELSDGMFIKVRVRSYKAVTSRYD